MWQGHLTLKNESAAVQLHFLSGNVQLAKSSLPGTGAGRSPALRIAQRMRLEQTQLEGVHRRMQVWKISSLYIHVCTGLSINVRVYSMAEQLGIYTCSTSVTYIVHTKSEVGF